MRITKLEEARARLAAAIKARDEYCTPEREAERDRLEAAKDAAIDARSAADCALYDYVHTRLVEHGVYTDAADERTYTSALIKRVCAYVGLDAPVKMSVRRYSKASRYDSKKFTIIEKPVEHVCSMIVENIQSEVLKEPRAIELKAAQVAARAAENAAREAFYAADKPFNDKQRAVQRAEREVETEENEREARAVISQEKTSPTPDQAKVTAAKAKLQKIVNGEMPLPPWPPEDV